MSGFQGMIRSLVEQYGQQVTLKRTESGGFDPATGTVGTTTYEVDAKAGPPHDFLTDNISNTLIQRGDTVIDLVGDLDMTSTGASAPQSPQPSDKVDIGSQEWNIVDVGRTYAEGQIVGYRLQLRR